MHTRTVADAYVRRARALRPPRVSDLRRQLVDLLGKRGDLLGQRGVPLELELLFDEVVVGLLLLELRLPVLPDHHEGRQEDRLERDDEGQRRPGAVLEEDHPQAESDRVDVHEAHRAGECCDPIRDAQLELLVAVHEHRLDDRVVDWGDRHLLMPPIGRRHG